MEKRRNVASTVLILMLVFMVAFSSSSVAGQKKQNNHSEDFSEDLGDDFEDDFGEDFQETKEESAAAEKSESRETEESSAFLFGGHLKAGSSFNYAHKKPDPGDTDWRGLSSLKTELQLELDARLSGSWQLFVSGEGFHDFVYSIRGRDTYTSEVLDNYETEAELRKAYLRGKLTKKLDLKVGRQIVVWGKSDNIRVTDILNPIDLREPGLTDLEDLRLPVAMTRLDFYHGRWGFSGIAVHEHRYDKMPEYGSDFYPFSLPPFPEEKPSSRIENTELAFSANGIFIGWDISFYYANFYNDEAHIEFFPYPAMHHSRISMFGGAFNIAQGNWLLKTEAAFLDGIRFSDFYAGMMPSVNSKTYSRLDVLAGVEYSGFTDTTVSIEAVNRYYTNFNREAELSGEEENSFETAVRISRDFFNETLNLTFLALVYAPTGDDGALFRLTAEYDLTDNIEITGGIVDYKSGDLVEFSKIENNDRLYFNVKYSF
ncbi:MAG: DUF1302 family protein [Desulfobacterales bacterium]